MAELLKNRWITEHRRWEDFLSAAAGVVIILSPALAGDAVSPAVNITIGLVGVIITMVALLEIVSLQRWEEFIEIACGGWIILSPVLLDYGGTLRIWHFVLGALVVAIAFLELWQDRGRRFDG
jgi:hypothetical protein